MKSKHKKAKLYWELVRLSEENTAAQKALGYKPLDKPIPHGYKAYWELREDISRRDDAHIFEAILNDLGKNAWCKTKDFTVYNFIYRNYNEVKPYIKRIDEDYYNRILPQYQKWFQYAGTRYDKVRWGGVVRYYECNIPEYFFKMVIERDYKTHYKVVDEILLQEKAEIDAKLNREFPEAMRWHSGNAPKWYRKTFHVKNKNKVKAELKKAIANDDYDDLDVGFKHRHCANWYWW